MKKIVLLLLLVAVVGGIALYLSSSDDPFRSSGVEQSDFAIADTASIGKIVIVDRSGVVAKLTRGENGWVLNGKYPAREDGIQTLLKTFKNVYIQRPVSRESLEEVNRVMATSTKKAEIYDLEGELIKTWYVGHSTMDQKGTFMLLETPENGKSSVPFIMDMKGFIGMLNTRFFTDENEWRSVQLLSYPDLNLQEIEVEYPKQPEASFSIRYDGGNDLRLFDGNGLSVAAYDTTTLKDYMFNFKQLSFENFKTGLTAVQNDSVKSTIPYQVIRISDQRTTHEISLWAKGATNQSSTADSSGTDLERIYGQYNDGELAIAQRFMWDKFRAPLKAFLSKE